ncbi:hypothetical protein [Undibacterium fentianense]|uniref:Uncharacterized protein n=1 Tax=Undibacterium fentianense TaxID=2828728 RepID=A0A941E5K4_9BURK|nr:hypothetical protein [Undibacterium fentianense]MBR7801477.1 hypothetical protein [Undibacterium fentianense]
MSEQQLREELNAVYRSTSWRMTAPLRLFATLIKQPRLIMGLPKRVIRRLMHFVMRRQKLNNAALFILKMFPRWRQGYLVRLGHLQAPSIPKTINQTVSVEMLTAIDMHSMSAQARDVFANLKPNKTD